MKRIRYYIALFSFMAVLHAPVLARDIVTDTEISGTVYQTANGKPLAGAQVSIPGVASATTSEDGVYRLRRSFSSAVMLIKAPGFVTKQIPIRGRTSINIWLIDDSFNDVYGEIVLPFVKKDKLRATQSVSTHSNRRDYQSGSATVENILQSGVNGLNTVSRSGMPGAGANLFLNGINSIHSNNQPLIVVDGLIYDNQPFASLIGGNSSSALSDIAVHDIDNITILKDGGSVYGSKGANGVILINTIQAREAATRIDFHAYSGVNFEPDTKYKMLDAWSYKNYLTDMLLSQGMSTTQIQALPYINQEKPTVENWGISGNKDYYRYNQQTDWQDEVFRTSLNSNYHVNITGGNEKTLFAFGVGYLGHEGLVENTSFNRYSTRANAKIKMTDWFRLNANVSFVYSERDLKFEGADQNFNPVMAALVKAPFTSAKVYNVIGQETPNLEGVDMFNISNPTAIINNSKSESNRFRFNGGVDAEIKFTSFLKANFIFGLTSDKVTKESVFLPNAGVFHPALASGEITNQSQQLRNSFSLVNTEGMLSYEKNFDETQNVTARIGSRILTAKNELDWGKAFNTSSDEMKTLGDGRNTLAQVGGMLGSWASVSNYLNLEYAHSNRYFISINAALDGSSRFGKNADGIRISNNVFGLFPSLNAAWIVTGEKFMANQDFFDLLKVRAGYSVSGNDDIGNYSARYYYEPQVLLGAYGLVRANIPNDKLKWETNRKATVGLDFAMFKERLNLSVDLYNSITSDLISINAITPATGMSVTLSNDGSLRNRGIDVNINGRVIDRNDFKWDLGLNISHYKNTLLSIANNQKITQAANGFVISKTGAPVAQFYGYQTDGILNSADEATEAGLSIQKTDGTLVPFTAGDVKFVDRDKNNIIDENDMTVIGNPNPDVFGSLNSLFIWKRFSMNTVFTYSIGSEVYNLIRSEIESLSNTDNQTIAAQYRWKTNGQETLIPKAVWGDPMQNSRFSDRWIEDGSYVRLKSLTFAYDIPLNTKLINNLQIYLTGNNLLTFTKYLGYDPEFSTSQNPVFAGIDTGVSAQPRTLLFGIKLGL
ncbi:MAG: SusC/RagA family TonB-linked outer membrane protein [Paludibacteraceae bacterium]|nr:SusC/RagA family TonB-linked outer membrane protein [Paludibacteraceae bacterium]